MSDTAMTRSPVCIIPLALRREKVRLRLLSMSSEKLNLKGISPHWRFNRLLTDVVVVNANIGQSGRLRDKRDAKWPVFVYTKRASTPKLLAAKSSEIDDILKFESFKTIISKLDSQFKALQLRGYFSLNHKTPTQKGFIPKSLIHKWASQFKALHVKE